MIRIRLTIVLLLGIVFSVPAAPVISTNYFQYNSTVSTDATGLAGAVYYDSSRSERLPLLVVAHPYTQSGESGFMDSNGTNLLLSLASNGFVVATFTMRGRVTPFGTAGGHQDDSGLEIHDIYDGIRYVQTNWFWKLNGHSAMVGFSGGGGNVMAFASKHPDYLNQYISYFGISDYLYDTTFGWGYEVPANQSSLKPNISASVWGPTNLYEARWAIEAAGTNMQGGYLNLFHNTSDSVVPVDQSSRMNDAFAAAGNTRIAYSNSASLYVHGLPSSSP